MPKADKSQTGQRNEGAKDQASSGNPDRKKGLAHEEQDSFIGRGRAGNEFQDDCIVPSRHPRPERREE